jgi:hypothetical protein
MLRWVATTAVVFCLFLPAAARQVHLAAGVDAATEEEADRYLAANQKLVKKDLPSAILGCARSVDPKLVADFEFAVEVGKGGKPGKTVAEPSTAFTTCVTKAVSAMEFSEPPRVPLGVYFEVAIRD